MAYKICYSAVSCHLIDYTKLIIYIQHESEVDL